MLRTQAREELRRQIGTLRFDLNTLATAKTGKDEKKKALALRKSFISAVRVAAIVVMLASQYLVLAATDSSSRVGERLGDGSSVGSLGS